MNKLKLLIFSILFVVSIHQSFSQSGDCGICDACDPDPLIPCAGYTNQEACYLTAPECGGIPLNDNKVLLVLGGVVLAIGYKTRERLIAYKKRKKVRA